MAKSWADRIAAGRTAATAALATASQRLEQGAEVAQAKLGEAQATVEDAATRAKAARPAAEAAAKTAIRKGGRVERLAGNASPVTQAGTRAGAYGQAAVNAAKAFVSDYTDKKA